MTVTPPCLTVDVEDFYEGMAVLGHPLERPAAGEPGLVALARLLERSQARITLFVVGRHAAEWGNVLESLGKAGHEIASHGPDHGRLPTDPRALADWLHAGREMVEQASGTPVRGFRAPRFDVPAGIGLREFRELTAAAGFAYVSDTWELGPSSPVAELPIVSRWRIPVGGGSYQRIIPRPALLATVRRTGPPVVMYYHSYDFGTELPALRTARSPLVASQLFGRRRIGVTFEYLLDQVGSQTCTEALDVVR